MLLMLELENPGLCDRMQRYLRIQRRGTTFTKQRIWNGGWAVHIRRQKRKKHREHSGSAFKRQGGLSKMTWVYSKPVGERRRLPSETDCA